MIITLLGFDVVDYDSKTSGNHVHGVRIFGAQDREVDKTHTGQSTFECFLSNISEFDLVEGGRYEVQMAVSPDRKNPGSWTARPAGLIPLKK